jgi:DnaJ homologue, subfamily C, member 28, conserved domain
VVTVSRYESWIDRQIREAQERGEFDNLPGTGKPIPNRNELFDEDWWIKQWIERAEITGPVPTSLKIRKEAEELMETVAKESDEGAVRRIVVRLNDRIDRARRSQVDGPPVYLEPFDVDEVVVRWRAARSPER